MTRRRPRIVALGAAALAVIAAGVILLLYPQAVVRKRIRDLASPDAGVRDGAAAALLATPLPGKQRVALVAGHVYSFQGVCEACRIEMLAVLRVDEQRRGRRHASAGASSTSAI